MTTDEAIEWGFLAAFIVAGAVALLCLVIVALVGLGVLS